MASVVKKVSRKSPANNPLSHSFNTAEEGAQAKADYVLETVLKDFNWEAFVAKKQGVKKQD